MQSLTHLTSKWDQARMPKNLYAQFLWAKLIISPQCLSFLKIFDAQFHKVCLCVEPVLLLVLPCLGNTIYTGCGPVIGAGGGAASSSALSLLEASLSECLLIVSKIRNVCKNKDRKKAFGERFKRNTPLPGQYTMGKFKTKQKFNNL